MRPLDPEGIGVEAQDRVAGDQRQHLLQAAAGLEQSLPLVRDDHLRAAPPAQMRLDEVGEVMDVDDRRPDPGLLDPVEGVVEERAAADGDQGLRQSSP